MPFRTPLKHSCSLRNDDLQCPRWSSTVPSHSTTCFGFFALHLPKNSPVGNFRSSKPQASYSHSNHGGCSSLVLSALLHDCGARSACAIYIETSEEYGCTLDLVFLVPSTHRCGFWIWNLSMVVFKMQRDLSTNGRSAFRGVYRLCTLNGAALCRIGRLCSCVFVEQA